MANPRALTTSACPPAPCVGGYPPSGVMDVRTMGQIMGRAAMPSDAVGTVLAGTRVSILLDDFGQAQTGNVALTNADATFFGGRCQQGEIITIFGCQFALQELEPIAPPPPPPAPDTAITNTAPTVFQDFMANCSIRLNLKGQSFAVGNFQLYPCGNGSTQLPKNGGPNTFAFRFPDSMPVQITSNDQLFIEVLAERAFNLSGNDHVMSITAILPSTTSVSLANLSGA